jgi:hypothetical protein
MKTAAHVILADSWGAVHSKRYRVIYQPPEGGPRTSAALPYREALALAHRFNHELRRRMKTRRTIC